MDCERPMAAAWLCILILLSATAEAATEKLAVAESSTVAKVAGTPAASVLNEPAEGSSRTAGAQHRRPGPSVKEQTGADRADAPKRAAAGGAEALFALDEERMLSRDEIAAVFRARMTGFPKSKAHKLATHLVKLAKQYGFDPAFLLSLIHVESSFQVRVVSNKNAVGLMQVLPTTAEFVAERWGIPYKDGDLYNPFINMTIGTRYLAYLRDKYNGYMPHFLAAYNAGPGRVDKSLARNQNRTRISLSYVEKISEQFGRFVDVDDSGSKKVTGKSGAPGEDIGV